MPRLSPSLSRSAVATVLLAFWLLATGGGPAWAQASTPLFSATLPRAALAQDAARTDPQVVRTREVTANLPLLAAPSAASSAGAGATAKAGAGASQAATVGQRLTLNLFDDMEITAIASAVDTTERGVSWTGSIEGIEQGQVVLVVSNGVLAANITLPERLYQVRFLREGVYQVQQVDARLLPPDHPPGYPQALQRRQPAAAADPAPPTAQADSGAVIDVMVVYSPAARVAAGGTAAMLANIDLGISQTNTSYQNSGIVPRVRLVRAEEVSYVEAASDPLGTALDCLTAATDGCLDSVHTLRNTYGADLVSLWLEASDYCGIAWLSTGASTGFSAVARSCAYAAGAYSFGHEMGHNMGARHDVYVDAATTPYPHGHGYVNTSAASPWRTMMAYNNACAAVGKSCTRLPYWSNPGITNAGAAMGNATTADNHRVLNDTAFTVANYRSTVSSCSYALSGTSASAAASGASASTTVTTTTGCAWTAVSNASWITVTAGATASGSGTASFTVAANTGTAARTGTVSIAGQTFTVTQAGAVACSYSLSSTSESVAAGASFGNVTVNTGSGCGWTATSNASWLTVTSSAAASGTASLGYSVAANTAAVARTGTFTIAGQTFTIVQAGAVASCYFVVSSLGTPLTSLLLDFSAAAATASLDVTAPSGCSWSVASRVAWATVTSATSVKGPGSISIAVQANTGATQRTGELVVAGYTLRIAQQPFSANCSFSLDRPNEIVASSGKDIVVGVLTSLGCNWTATSNKPWITLDPAFAKGSASGIVRFTVTSNPNTSTRRGTLTLAGRTFDVVQRAANSVVSTPLDETLTPAATLINTVIYAGAYAQYTVSVDSAGVRQVKDSVIGRDGTDRMTGVNRLQFFDGNVAYDTSSATSAGAIYRLYAATFNRTPDVAGLGYWILQADGGQSPADMAAGFINSAEFQTLYGVTITDSYGTGLNVTSLVTGFYQNILHRTPDPGGLAYYAGQITSRSQTLGQILAQLSDSPENRAQVAAQIQNGIAYTPWEP